MYIKCGFHWDLWSLEFLELGKEMPIKLKTSNIHNPCKTVFKATIQLQLLQKKISQNEL